MRERLRLLRLAGERERDLQTTSDVCISHEVTHRSVECATHAFQAITGPCAFPQAA